MTQPNRSPVIPFRRYHFPDATRRLLLLILFAVLLVTLASSDSLHDWLIEVLDQAEALIREQPILGACVFVLLSAASAMFVFVSSAVFVPVGVYVWGNTLTLVLLWTGWILGGIFAYTLSLRLGRPIVKSLWSATQLDHYENLVSSRAPFGLVLLLQLALPSEVPGYLLGIVRYPFWKYMAALALGEFPYAIATIYLGSGFIEQNLYSIVGVGLLLATLSGGTLYVLRRRFRSHDDNPPDAP